MSQLSFISENVYHLKQEYGGPTDLYHITSITPNLQTGVKVIVKDKYHIKRAILLPTALANLFVTGTVPPPTGYQAPVVDLNKRILLVDNKDLPNIDVDLNNDYFVIRHERYDIKQITMLEDNRSTIFTTQLVKGAAINEIYDLYNTDILNFVQSVN